MVGRSGVIERMVELLKEEQTWMGRFYGHTGQARVARRETEYWEERLKEIGDDIEPFIRARYERNLRKARAREEYHKKQAEEARERLEYIRAELRKILEG